MRIPNQPAEPFCGDTPCIPWSSICAGVIIVIVGSAAFNLLGMSIGFTLLQPTGNIAPSLTWGTIIWLMLSAVLSMYAGGWVTGYYSFREGGPLSGIITSGLSLLIFFITAAALSGSVISTTFSTLNTIVSASASGAGAISSAVKGINKVAPELGENVKKVLPDLNSIIAKINKKAAALLPKDNEWSDEKLKKVKSQLEEYVDRYFASLGKEQGEQQENLKGFEDFLVEITGRSPDEINKTLDEWKGTYLEASEKAHQTVLKTGKTITKGLSRLAFVNFLIITLSLVAAAWGGRNGRKCREE
jgi:uncharacterized protein YoxC